MIDRTHFYMFEDNDTVTVYFNARDGIFGYKENNEEYVISVSLIKLTVFIAIILRMDKGIFLNCIHIHYHQKKFHFFVYFFSNSNMCTYLQTV